MDEKEWDPPEESESKAEPGEPTDTTPPPPDEAYYQDLPPLTPPAATEARPAGVPWEERDRLGFFTAFGRTVSESMLSPGDLFRRVPLGDGMGAPLLFAILINVLGAIASELWQVLGVFSLGTLTHDLTGPMAGQFFESWLTIVSIPFIVILSLFVSAGIAHLFLVLLGGAKGGFTTTFRVFGYAQSPSILLVIPICGVVVAIFWALVIEIIGLAAAHRTSVPRAAIAVLLPSFLCLGAILTLAVVMGVLAGMMR